MQGDAPQFAQSAHDPGEARLISHGGKSGRAGWQIGAGSNPAKGRVSGTSPWHESQF